ncbi:MAG: hypothetical protein HY094_09895 [Candidatus Melainabacteria bacterium]|nr:hypothetical protein [Candidatus Melainabacteria bacterium]
MFILQLQGLTSFAGNSNPSERLAEIRSKITLAENKVRDLEALLTSIIVNPDSAQFTQDVDGNTPGVQIYVNRAQSEETVNADASAIRDLLYRARAEEGELRTAEQFWNEIVSANKTAEQKTQELFKGAG